LKVCPVGTFLQAAEFSEMFATGETGTLPCESRSVDPETGRLEKYPLLQEIEGYGLCDIYIYIYNADEPSLFFNLQCSKTFTFQRDFFHGSIKSKQWVIVLLCNADGSETLPPLVTGKCGSTCCIKNVKRLPTKYTSNTNSWMTTKIF
jgi:hypothetical protein